MQKDTHPARVPGRYATLATASIQAVLAAVARGLAQADTSRTQGAVMLPA